MIMIYDSQESETIDCNKLLPDYLRLGLIILSIGKNLETASTNIGHLFSNVKAVFSFLDKIRRISSRQVE